MLVTMVDDAVRRAKDNRPKQTGSSAVKQETKQAPHWWSRVDYLKKVDGVYKRRH